MRYWKLKESNRVMAASSEIAIASRWEEISEEEYHRIKVYSSIEKNIDEYADLRKELDKK